MFIVACGERVKDRAELECKSREACDARSSESESGGSAASPSVLDASNLARERGVFGSRWSG